jgi:death-on-curing protein
VTQLLWVSEAEAVGLHDRSIALAGGAPGLRDAGLLASALARAVNLSAYGEADLFVLAAAHAEAIARNHPFVDGNKRTGFLVAVLFLRKNGWRVAGQTGTEHEDMMVALARGALDRGQAAGHLRGHAAPGP